MSDELSRGDETRNPAQILVIDDEPFILEYIGAILSSHNIVPILEYTFEKALLQIRSKPVDLVITDLFMPGMGGIEGIKVLKDERFTIIQIPFNYLDNQWNNDEFKSLIQKRHDVEIHVRSIFLQGILVNDFKHWPKIKEYDFEPIYDNITNLCKKYNLSKLELVVGYIKSIKWIDSVLFGVDNIEQLKENIALYKNTTELNKTILNECTKLFSNIPKELVNPVLWN